MRFAAITKKAWWQIAFGFAVFVHAASGQPGPTPAPTIPPPRFEDFVGSEACARCHQKEFDLWKTSTHARAGGEPRNTKLIARFDGRPLRFKDAVVTPTTNQLGDPLFVVQIDGAPRFEINVQAVVGGGHMYGGGTQSFFDRFPDGTLRFLPFDFIRQENLWFVQLRRDMTWSPISTNISLRTDLANWPPHRVLGTLTESSNCQNCHGSQINTRYDETTRRYQTRYQSLDINCESCHGPGRRHLEIVSQPGFEKKPDIGMAALATLPKDQSLMVCFQCHARKDSLREDDYLPGANLEDYYSLKLALLSDSPFLADGRVKSFDYQSNHQFSDCYRSGSMTCVDCHDPHTQGYRDNFGRALEGRFDNAQCTGCHASKSLAPERHSHHAVSSAGNQCVACHMPYLQHHGVGTQLVYSRSDHSIPIPRPAFDQQLGIENACQKCHADKPVAWQESKVKEWYGAIKPHPELISRLLSATNSNGPRTPGDQWLQPGVNHPMAQAAGLARYIQDFIRPGQNTRDDAALEKLKTFARAADLDLKALALMALHLGWSQQPGVQAFLEAEASTWGDRRDAILRRWSIAADHLGEIFAAKGDLTNAIACFTKSLEAQPDNYITMSHLAQAHLKSGDLPNAIGWLRNALRLKPAKAALHFQLAQAYAQSGQIDAAIASLEAGLSYASDDRNARRLLEQLRRAP